MKIGKISEAVLKRSVLSQIHTRREEVLLGASVGEDCAAVAVAEDEMLVISTDPITGTVQDIGDLAIQITVNDLASAGAEPVGVMLTVLLPERVSEQKMRLMMEQAEAACANVHVQIMGGHTEVTRVVNHPLISVVGVGKAKKETDIDSRRPSRYGYYNLQSALGSKARPFWQKKKKRSC